MKALNNSEIEDLLFKLKDWSYENNSLSKTFQFTNFEKALKAIHSIGALAVKLNHHPDWSNSYSQLVISITTKDLGCLSNLDAQFALEAEEQLTKFI